MKTEVRTIIYQNELNDEFAGDHISPRFIDGTYPYLRDGITGRLAHIFWYRIVAIPLALLYMKLHFHHRIQNRSILKPYKKQAYFMYGNHTHFLADALIPTMVNMPKNVSVIVHANNVSMPVLGRITPYLGALPLPADREATKNFMNAVQKRIRQKGCVMIYPEAHIWPYYTDIRPFTDLSFRYPVQMGVPVFCLTNTYQKRRFSKTPRIVTYIDGPFIPDSSLPGKEQKKQLRDAVYQCMKKRSEQNNVCIIRYLKAAVNEEVTRNDGLVIQDNIPGGREND